MAFPLESTVKQMEWSPSLRPQAWYFNKMDRRNCSWLNLDGSFGFYCFNSFFVAYLPPCFSDNTPSHHEIEPDLPMSPEHSSRKIRIQKRKTKIKRHKSSLRGTRTISTAVDHIIAPAHDTCTDSSASKIILRASSILPTRFN